MENTADINLLLFEGPSSSVYSSPSVNVMRNEDFFENITLFKNHVIEVISDHMVRKRIVHC